ncbi:GNAT family N-acetyltransferase [Nocardia sp. NPDC051832]|uniref:GNAT family N-acetyltransferase n=1 Tax=Nocardia sp. NPDC051832 TaxID=3155673 RepID=UPI003441CBE2
MTTSRFNFRTTVAADQQFLAEMLIEAAHASGHELTLEALPATTDSYRYVADWGQPSDLGVIAHDDHGTPAGAAWLRHFDRTIASPAFIDEHTPELTIATTASARGQGLGTALLQRLQDTAAQAGVPALALGVHRENQPAQQLYRNEGWQLHTMAGDYNILVKHLDRR